MITFPVAITSGFGAASSHDVHGLPFEPVPGTLNVLTIGPEVVDAPPAGSISWFDHVEQWWTGSVGDVPVAVIGVDVDMPEDHKLEVFAPVKMRDLHDGLDDGDVLLLTVTP